MAFFCGKTKTKPKKPYVAGGFFKSIRTGMKYLCMLSFLLGYLFCFGQNHTLDFFIQQAKQSNPTFRNYQNQVLSNKIDSQLLRAAQKTQVNFINNASYAPIIHGYGYDEVISNIANVNSLVQASNSYVGKNNLAAQYRTITLQNRSLLETMRLSEQDLVRTITEQYITAYGDLLVTTYNKEVYDLMKTEEEVLKKLTQASVYKQTDYLNFYVTMQQQELIYLQAQIQYNTDYLTLNYLAGIADTSIQQLQEPLLTDTVSADLYQSIFVQPFLTDSLRLVNEKILIDYLYKPRLGAYTDAGFTSSLQYTPYKNFGFSAGVSLVIPIYDGRQKQLKYSKIVLQEKSRLTNKDFFVNQYRQQIAVLQQQLSAINLLVNKIRQQISYAYTLVTANSKLLETGDITMKDYITAISNYLNAKNLLIQNNITRLKIVNQLNYWKH
jgi:outer membrane protein TolC